MFTQNWKIGREKPHKFLYVNIYQISQRILNIFVYYFRTHDKRSPVDENKLFFQNKLLTKQRRARKATDLRLYLKEVDVIGFFCLILEKLRQ